MSWDAIGAVGQMISAFAFVLVIIQIRHVRAETQRAMGRERVDRSIQILTASAANERVMTLRAKANDSLRPGSLPPFLKAMTEQFNMSLVDALSLNADQNARWTSIAHTFSYLPELSPHERAHFERMTRSATTEPFFQFWYGHLRSSLDPDAVRYIDNVIAQQPR